MRYKHLLKSLGKAAGVVLGITTIFVIGVTLVSLAWMSVMGVFMLLGFQTITSYFLTAGVMIVLGYIALVTYYFYVEGK